MKKLININQLQVKKYYLLIKVDQVKCTHSPLGKAIEKQTKTIEEQGRKHVEALEVLKSNTQQ